MKRIWKLGTLLGIFMLSLSCMKVQAEDLDLDGIKSYDEEEKAAEPIGEGWVTLNGMPLKFGFVKDEDENSRYFEIYGAFYTENSNGTVSVVYWLKDMDSSVGFEDDWGERTYSGIRMKKVNGEMYFYLQDLYAKKINPYSPMALPEKSSEKTVTVSLFNKTVKVSQLYAVDAVGAAKGHKRLKGFPGENKYIIYFMGTPGSYSISVREVNPRSNQKVKWSYNGHTYVCTREQCYSLFAQTSILQSYYGVSSNVFSINWFKKTFGSVYDDYFDYKVFEGDAERLVEAYFDK